MKSCFKITWIELLAISFFTTTLFPESMARSLKYIVLNHFNLSQDVLRYTVKNLYKKREWYRKRSQSFDSFGPILIPFYCISQVVNLTLITDDYLLKSNISDSEYIDIYTSATSYPGTSYSLYNILLKYHKKAVPYTIISNSKLNFNFVYCDVPKFKKELPWHMNTLLFSFQTNVWYTVLASMIATVYIIKILAKEANILETSFMVLRSMLPDNADASRKFQKIPLYYVWLLMCFVISNYYSAILTSIVISPSKEDAFSYFADVAKNNFTLLLSAKGAHQILNATARFQLTDHRSNEDILAINNMLDFPTTKLRVLNNEVHNESEQPAPLLAYNRKLVLVHFWQYAIAYLNDVNQLFGNIRPHRRPVHCYIGERLIPGEELYQFIETPPDQVGGLLKRVSLYMMESGISQLWYEEYVALRHSTRVQDRSMVVSRTKIRFDFEEERLIIALEMQGKISSVFFLGFICYLISILSFAVEIVLHDYFNINHIFWFIVKGFLYIPTSVGKMIFLQSRARYP